ncbi:putative bifunctional diguanylate cyclase/phosphodiesterase [Hansschlegelia zhihuaiae]|uniref:EAL domain-containing protein n=1 Tax=Hansschlegelia zhihuaiae TaxID=405005 RepID=A0A4Q0MBP3_9HYPH|nr:EAL domain-containing protein [Hansschlegelia zhihuaiae]RXF70279.1 EAL domain-containing protein [Hansschlegelia zhihuaiae]
MLEQFQQVILEMIARGRSVEETAEHICRRAESLADGALCSILTVDRAGLLHPLAGPSIPDDYSAALDGIVIGPDVGSCGTAAFLRKPIVTRDISTDPRWASYGDLARRLDPLGVRACWSSPILHGDGRVIGTFGFYFAEARGPNEQEERIVAECVDLCSILLEREEVRAENHRLAYFDVLTELGNRANFNRTLDAAHESGRGRLGLLFVDVDHLKRVNDTLGHAKGDKLIREVGRRIAQNVAAGRAFRVGGDEFAVLVEGADVDLPATAARILAAMREPVRCDGHALASAVTCGGATSGASDPCDIATLRQRADLALYHAKEIARGGFVLYGEDLASTIARRFQILQTVTAALAEDRVEAHYQPVVRLDTQEIIGVEALCRVRTREGEFLPAAQFMEAMQDLSIGSLVTDRMLGRVAADIRHWLDRGIPLQHVGVNVSMADFQKGDLRERISAAFARCDAPLKHVILEVTESVYMGENDRKVARAVEELRAEGLLVALDDFGTGFASLTHLLTFPVDIIKIDKSFVDRVSTGDAGEVIVTALLEMAKGLGMRIVAEGVESREQADQLQRLGCKLAQGYLFGRPVDRDATTDVLQRFAQRPAAQAATPSGIFAA